MTLFSTAGQEVRLSAFLGCIVVIARDDVSEDDIYNFVSDIYENAGNLSHGKAAELDLDFAASVTAVPYHAGAAKYFAEKGITVPTK